MMNLNQNIKLLLLGVACVWSCTSAPQESTPQVAPAIIPEPVRLEVKEGTFELSEKTLLSYSANDPEGKKAVSQLQQLLQSSLGYRLQELVNDEGRKSNTIGFKVDSTLSRPEGYRLNIGDDRIEVMASSGAGYFYAIQTLRQLWEISGGGEQSVVSLPQVEIEDYPRFEWRGMMLDVSRHFFPKEFIKKFIDYLAMNKLNTFHWHLIDDQGWRIEIKKYPELINTGAWRVNKEHLHWNSRPAPEPGEVADFGGFYTREDIKEIVEYAADRHVTVVPEIEMPAHVSAAIASYPWLSCKQEPIAVPSGGVWPITDIYCAGNDSTFLFLEDVLTEVMDLFPSQYIHIGGDEATKTAWEVCARCRKRMKEEKLADTHELQSYFIKRIEAFLNKHDRNLIGWDEILEGGLAPNAAVMSWRGMGGGIEAARKEHRVVMSPGTHLYFDHYQGQQQMEPLAIGGFSPISHVYTFDPAPDSLGQAADFIMGGQANLWTEYMPVPEHVEYMTFPRIYALAELLWTPRDKKNWDHFIQKVNRHLEVLDKLEVNYARSMFDVNITPEFNVEEGTIVISMETENPVGEIRYTTDGTDPDSSSEIYQSQLHPARTMTIKAGLFSEDRLQGKVSTAEIFVHRAFAKKVSYANPPAKRYLGNSEYVLTDGIHGDLNFGSGMWQGFRGEDLDVVIPLDEAGTLNQVRVGFLQDYGSWIFRPEKVTVYGSEDGHNFTILGEQPASLSVHESQKQLVHFEVDISGSTARYIKVVADNVGVCPEGHTGEGQPAWLFVDEVIVE